MSESEKVNLPVIPAVWTFDDLVRKVPIDWQNAQVCVNDDSNVVSNHRIKRVIFELNRDGSKVIILSPRQTKIEP